MSKTTSGRFPTDYTGASPPRPHTALPDHSAGDCDVRDHTLWPSFPPDCNILTSSSHLPYGSQPSLQFWLWKLLILHTGKQLLSVTPVCRRLATRLKRCSSSLPSESALWYSQKTQHKHCKPGNTFSHKNKVLTKNEPYVNRDDRRFIVLVCFFFF